MLPSVSDWIVKVTTPKMMLHCTVIKLLWASHLHQVSFANCSARFFLIASYCLSSEILFCNFFSLLFWIAVVEIEFWVRFSLSLSLETDSRQVSFLIITFFTEQFSNIHNFHIALFLSMRTFSNSFSHIQQNLQLCSYYFYLLLMCAVVTNGRVRRVIVVSREPQTVRSI